MFASRAIPPYSRHLKYVKLLLLWNTLRLPMSNFSLDATLANTQAMTREITKPELLQDHIPTTTTMSLNSTIHETRHFNARWRHATISV